MKIEEIKDEPQSKKGLELRIRETKFGKGLFSTSEIEPGTMLGFYTGNLREMTPELRGNDKLLLLRQKPPWYPKDVDFSKYNIVDARGVKNNFLQFMNDYRGIADGPNVSYLKNGMFFTNKRVYPDEQLLTNYGEKWWETYRKHYANDSQPPGSPESKHQEVS